MALSQKYDGVVLMPWFNLAEWKSVKELINSDDFESYQIAVNRMKIWKLRSNQIPVGIDGTYELLVALLAENNNLTHDELVHIYSISLLRFLNICAGNNDKQGTFYKTAEKNGLPLWLITLRHDIAHDPTIPSKKFLKLALIQCLQWVKEKYWEVSQMEDFVVSEETNFKELIYDYAKLKLLHFFNISTDRLIAEVRKKIASSVSAELSRGFTAEDFITLLEDHLIQSISTQKKVKDISLHIISTLVEEGIIFNINYISVNGVKRIPFNFVQIWHKLLNLLYENGTLFMLINKLADITESTNHEILEKEISSLWIAELYQELLETKKKYDTITSMNSELIDKKAAKPVIKSTRDTMNPQFNDILTFSNFEIMPLDDSKLFEKRILEAPNKYIINYLEMVLKFNANSESYIKKKINLIENLELSSTPYTDPVTIYCVEDLKNLQKKYSSEVDMKNTMKIQNGDKNGGRKRFRPLSDAEKFRFKGYPLGYMPQK